MANSRARKTSSRARKMGSRARKTRGGNIDIYNDDDDEEVDTNRVFLAKLQNMYKTDVSYLPTGNNQDETGRSGRKYKSAELMRPGARGFYWVLQM